MEFSFNSTASKTVNILQNCLKHSKARSGKSLAIRKTRKPVNQPEDANPANMSMSGPVTEQASSNLTDETQPEGLHLGFSVRVVSNTPPFLSSAEDNPAVCDDQFTQYKNHYKKIISNQYSQYPVMTHQEQIKKIFENGTYDYSSNENYKKCLKAEAEFLAEDYTEVNEFAKEISQNITLSSSISEGLMNATKLEDMYHDLRSIVLKHVEMKTQCQWHHSIYSEEYPVVNKAITDMDDLEDNMDQALREFDSLTDGFTMIFTNYNDNIVPVVQQVQGYLEGNTTKRKLRRIFEQSKFLIGLEDLLDNNANFIKCGENFMEEVETILEKVEITYKNLVHLKTAILTPYGVYKLQMVQLFGEVKDAHMQDAFNALKDGLDPALPRLVRLTLEGFKDAWDELKDELTERINDLVDEVNGFRDNLLEYEQSTVMNTDFFM